MLLIIHRLGKSLFSDLQMLEIIFKWLNKILNFDTDKDKSVF